MTLTMLIRLLIPICAVVRISRRSITHHYGPSSSTRSASSPSSSLALSLSFLSPLLWSQASLSSSGWAGTSCEHHLPPVGGRELQTRLGTLPRVSRHHWVREQQQSHQHCRNPNFHLDCHFLIMGRSVPAAWLIFTLIVLLIYLLTRCIFVIVLLFIVLKRLDHDNDDGRMLSFFDDELNMINTDHD